MKSNLLRAAFAAAALGFGSFAAHAATATGTLGVNFNLGQTCTTAQVYPVTFPGAATGAIAAETGTGVISVTCSTGAPYTVGLDAGLHPSTPGDTTTRRMAGAAQTTSYVTYDLWQNAGATTHWGNNSPVDTVGGTGTGAAQQITVYGQIPAQTQAQADVYMDTVTITVNY